MFKNFFLTAFALLIIFPATSFAATFKDVPEGHWAYKSVEGLAKQKIIQADAQKNFNGNNNATRYDLAIMLGGLVNKSGKNISAANPFSDIQKNNPAYKSVATLAKLQIMEGYADGTFKGDKEISRFELALTLNSFLNKISTTSNNSFTSNFSDVPSSHWAYPAVSRMNEEGFMEGYGDGTFKGNNSITKFELALIISQINDKYFS